MSEKTFELLLKIPAHEIEWQIRKQIGSGASFNYQQLLSICKREDLNTDQRVLVIIMMYPRVVDRAKLPFNEVVDAFPQEEQKEFLKRFKGFLDKNKDPRT